MSPNLPNRASGPLIVRTLVVDDNPAIHQDIQKLLLGARAPDPELERLEDELFGAPVRTEQGETLRFEVDSAMQGREGLQMVERAAADNNPYALALVDMRMPPGWDGLETIERIWEVDPRIQIIICTAYSDHTHREIVTRLAPGDRLLVLKKPFDSIELLQSAHALGAKWHLARQIQQHFRELDQRVRQRTAELRQELERRERAEDELRFAHRQRALGRLAGGVAHEVNTPLQFVSDNLHFLEEAFGRYRDAVQAEHRATDPDGNTTFDEFARSRGLDWLDGEVPQAVVQGLHGVRRVQHVVQAIMTFADERHERTPSECDVNRCMRTVLLVASQELRNIDVKLHIDPIDHFVCDVADLQQALLELIANAGQAILERHGSQVGGTIRIHAYEHDGDVVIEIADDGAGIAADVLPRIYDPFFTTREAGQGAGLGLTQVKAMVDRHNGEIEVRSEQGHGTTVALTLPLRPWRSKRRGVE